MTHLPPELGAFLSQTSLSLEESEGHLYAAWKSGEAIPRLADKTITPMAGARVDLEAYQFCDKKSGN